MADDLQDQSSDSSHLHLRRTVNNHSNQRDIIIKCIIVSFAFSMSFSSSWFQFVFSTTLRIVTVVCIFFVFIDNVVRSGNSTFTLTTTPVHQRSVLLFLLTLFSFSFPYREWVFIDFFFFSKCRSRFVCSEFHDKQQPATATTTTTYDNKQTNNQKSGTIWFDQILFKSDDNTWRMSWSYGRWLWYSTIGNSYMCIRVAAFTCIIT